MNSRLNNTSLLPFSERDGILIVWIFHTETHWQLSSSAEDSYHLKQLKKEPYLSKESSSSMIYAEKG